jgi:hyperosmotically inducible protein
MKTIRNFLILTIAVLGFSFSDAHAQNISVRQQAQTGMEQKVFKEILKLPYYGVFDNIAYRVDGNTVTLYGKVHQPITRSSAARTVQRIEGVENVVNNIEVLPLSNFDDSIRLRVLRTLQTNGGSLYRYFLGVNPSVKIIVDRGHVTLEGIVANSGDANLANILTSTVPGTFSVTNNLMIESRRGQ